MVAYDSIALKGQERRCMRKDNGASKRTISFIDALETRLNLLETVKDEAAHIETIAAESKHILWSGK